MLRNGLPTKLQIGSKVNTLFITNSLNPGSLFKVSVNLMRIVKILVDLLLVLTGLDGVILQYIPMFLSNEVKGQQLLNLRSDDLENIGVYTIGHQELILEAVGQLRNFVSIFEM